MKGLKCIACMAAVAVLAASFAGCSRQAPSRALEAGRETTQNQGQNAGPKDLAEISVEIFDRGVVPAEEGTVDNNRWTRWVNDQVKKDRPKGKVYPVPRNEEITKVNLLLASGDAPDMLYTYDDNALKQWADQAGSMSWMKRLRIWCEY